MTWFDWTYTDRPYFLIIILPVLLIILWFYFDAKGPTKKIQISSLKNFKGPSLLGKFRFLVPLFRLIALAFIIVALTRPQDKEDESYKQVSSDGIDIVIAFDVSQSMMAMDFHPNRLEAAREVATNFIERRKDDRMGLVIFEGEAFTQCPLTTDKEVLKNQFNLAKPGMMAQGTAIGMGLATAVNRLRESKAKSKVIILLTDGVNNQGNIDPSTAADIAKEYGIRVYTIGVGTKGVAKFPVQDMFGNISYQNMPVEIDEPLLNEIAQKTGGEYYRATDKESLQNIYNRIDKLEKSKINVVEFKRDAPERFHVFAFLALLFIAIEFFLRNIVFQSPTW